MLKLGANNKYVDITYNIITNSSNGISIEGIVAETINTYINIYNNTIAKISSDNATGIYLSIVDQINVKNNLLYEVIGKSTVKTEYNIVLANLTNAVFSNNMAYAIDPYVSTTPRYAYNSTPYNVYNLATWNALTGTIEVGTDIWSVNPLFISASDYNLQSTSPAIDVGVDVGLTIDYLGNFYCWCAGYRGL